MSGRKKWVWFGWWFLRKFVSMMNRVDLGMHVRSPTSRKWKSRMVPELFRADISGHPSSLTVSFTSLCLSATPLWLLLISSSCVFSSFFVIVSFTLYSFPSVFCIYYVPSASIFCNHTHRVSFHVPRFRSGFLFPLFPIIRPAITWIFYTPADKQSLLSKHHFEDKLRID